MNAVDSKGFPKTQLVPIPASATSSGVPGQFAYDSVYVYYCTALNTWGRAPLNLFASF